jgi:hypothetical protein
MLTIEFNWYRFPSHAYMATINCRSEQITHKSRSNRSLMKATVLLSRIWPSFSQVIKS